MSCFESLPVWIICSGSGRHEERQVIRKMLQLNKHSLLKVILPVYKISRIIKMDRLIKSLVLPADSKSRINALDRDRVKVYHLIAFNTITLLNILSYGN